MDQVVILAVLAVVFAVINFILWGFAWKNISVSKVPEEKKDRFSGEIALRIEDQLWGIIDRIKELEQSVENINKNILSGGGGGDIRAGIDKLNDISSKSAALLLKNYRKLDEIKSGKSLQGSSESELKMLKEFFVVIEESLQQLNSKVTALEKD